MKSISVWQPFATLIVKGFKVFETRTWPAPASLISRRIGIASTKSIRPEQRAHFHEEEFQEFYMRLDLPAKLEDLHFGFMLGTVVLNSVELMTPELMEDVSSEEKSYGWWQEGFYAWRLTDPVEFSEPIAVRGAQGIYEWNNPNERPEKKGEETGSTRPQDLRRNLRIVER